MSGIAAKYAGKRVFGWEIDDSKYAEELRTALGGLKGPLMKVAQMLSTIPDALPADYAAELAQLQSEAPPMGKPFVRRRMEAELGPDWRRRFESFQLEAAHAASLGQVHKAKLHDGRDVACKLQYPGISSTVEADLSQLKLILDIYRRYDAAIDTSEIYKEISVRLREELDYWREAKNGGLYRHMLRDEPHVHVPEIVTELSTGRLLTMEWVTGVKLTDLGEVDLETRRAIAQKMFRAWYVPFYEYGVIHGDPHLGNYTVRDDYDINLLDFGCIRVFQPKFVGGVIDLYYALRDGDMDLAVSAYEAWGFHDLTKEALEILNIWAAFLYAPLMEDRPRLIDENNTGQYGQAVAMDVHKRLKEYGGVTPPREFVLMDRAAIGLGSVFLRLNADLNWHRMFMELAENFDRDRLARQQAEALDVAGLEAEA
ncbi:MAG: AarF/ABC1/UbiB kinase family protein [Alphaproteobacteria bacterium]|nr:AarF/ABC1/UbiB kinase family protein [Alphaproteobacteria bacterium]